MKNSIKLNEILSGRLHMNIINEICLLAYEDDNIKDNITEYWTTTGIDSVFSSVSYALTGVVDRSILMGFSNLATSVENFFENKK